MPRPFVRASRAASTATAGVLATLLLVPPLSPPIAAASTLALPLGDPGLSEVRTIAALAPGVELMTIVRGTKPAAKNKIGTTSRGPWRIRVLSIDPATAKGGLRSTYGPDLARVEKTSDLVRLAGGLAGVNASYFTFSKDPRYPGDPVGLSVGAGALLSEPQATSTEVDLLVDSATNAVRIGRLSWSGSVRNTSTDATMKLSSLNHPPVVPSGCVKLKDQTRCASRGDVSVFTPEFGPTPSGHGLEAVLNSAGCLTTLRTSRGTTLTAGQFSIQATGKQSVSLKTLITSGCVKRSLTLTDADHRTVKLTKTTYGVAGRYWLTRAGKVVAPKTTGAYFARNPRTMAGTTADGTIMLVTIDGRRTTSVGATLVEEANIARSLGLQNAINLDGGGSTSMALATGLINTPSGTDERAVGDALVYVPPTGQ